MNSGWNKIHLEQLFEFKYGKGLPDEFRNKKGSINVYGSNGIVGKHDKPLTSSPTIIIGRKGSVGEVHFSSTGCWPIDTTYYINDFPCNLPPRYWLFYLKSLQLGQHDKSSAIPGVSRKDIYNLIIPLPPLPEQHRIVEKLDKLLAKVTACKERLDTIPAILKRFRQSVLAAACSGRLTADWREKNPVIESGKELLKRIYTENKKFVKCKTDQITTLEIEEYDISSWCLGTIESVIDTIVDCPHSTPKWTTSGKLCVRTTNFQPFKLNLDSVKYVSKETYFERISRLNPQAGDVLYSREGGILGIACQIPSGVELCLGQRMMLFRCKDNWLDGQYLSLLLNSEIILSQVKELITGTASPHLNVGDAKKFKIPIPPNKEQKEIVRRVEALFKKSDAIEARYKKAKEQVDKLTQSILAKAFRGELVPQDPNDESAAVLLERIQAERAKKDAETKPKATKKRIPVKPE